MAAVYSRFIMGDLVSKSQLPNRILAVILRQLVTAYAAEQHSMPSAVVHSAQDIARLAQGSKALHTTAMAMWHHLTRLLSDPSHAMSQYCTLLPHLGNLSWVSNLQYAC